MMDNVLFCIPLREKSLDKYEAFIKAFTDRTQEYQAMLKRYDILNAHVWHKNINGCDYIYVYHEVGPAFREKMKGWDNSADPFDQWFRKNLVELYNIQNSSDMLEPRKLLDFEVKE